MAIYNTSRSVTTQKGLKSVVDATVYALRPLGGYVTANSESGTIRIVDGKTRITGNFLFTSDALILVDKKVDDKYVISAQIQKKPNGMFGSLLVLGLCIWPIWLANIYYLLIDVGKEYDRKLSGVERYL